MITLEPTEDWGTVREILTNPRSYMRMANDDAPAPEGFTLEHPERFSWVLAKLNAHPVAVFLLDPVAPAVAEVHFTFIPQAWGQSVDVAREFLAWVWRETSLNLLRGNVPSYNRLCLQLAKVAGFNECGIETGAGTRGGKKFDRIQTEVRRPA